MCQPERKNCSHAEGAVHTKHPATSSELTFAVPPIVTALNDWATSSAASDTRYLVYSQHEDVCLLICATGQKQRVQNRARFARTQCVQEIKKLGEPRLATRLPTKKHFRRAYRECVTASLITMVTQVYAHTHARTHTCTHHTWTHIYWAAHTQQTRTSSFSALSAVRCTSQLGTC